MVHRPEGTAIGGAESMMKRDEIETLLPWYAAGTLSRSDADRVEQALASDQELAQCFELIRKELAEAIYLNETLGAPSQHAAEKLFAAIDAEDAQSRGRRRQRLDPSPSVLASP
jgi:anti-sigma factor RsiW